MSRALLILTYSLLAEIPVATPDTGISTPLAFWNVKSIFLESTDVPTLHAAMQLNRACRLFLFSFV